MSGLEEEFAGKIVASNVDATTPETAAVCQKLGFKNHGLVIRSADGETLWQQSDHEVNVEEVRAKISELTGTPM